MPIDGIYTPNTDVIPVDGAVTIVRALDEPGAGRTPICVAVADLSPGTGACTMTITEGYLTTPAASGFVAGTRIGYLCSGANGPTVVEPILKVVVKRTEPVAGVTYGRAIQIVTTGATAIGHVRTDGKTIVV